MCHLPRWIILGCHSEDSGEKMRFFLNPFANMTFEYGLVRDREEWMKILVVARLQISRKLMRFSLTCVAYYWTRAVASAKPRAPFEIGGYSTDCAVESLPILLRPWCAESLDCLDGSRSATCAKRSSASDGLSRSVDVMWPSRATELLRDTEREGSREFNASPVQVVSSSTESRAVWAAGLN